MDSRELILEMANFRPKAEEGGAAGLLAEAHAGSLAAFDQLMRLHEKQVLGTALRLLGNPEDAQDAAQETFLRLYRNLSKLPDMQEIRSWLYRVTVNICHDAHRGRKRRRWEPLSGPEPASAAPDPEAVWDAAERGRLLEQALTTLPEKERAAVVLRDVEGLTTREVAEILGSSEVTVRSQICVARRKLKRFTDRYLKRHL